MSPEELRSCLERVTPKRGCKRCNGEGNIGFNLTTKQKELCPCVKKKLKEEFAILKATEEKYKVVPPAVVSPVSEVLMDAPIGAVAIVATDTKNED